MLGTRPPPAVLTAAHHAPEPDFSNICTAAGIGGYAPSQTGAERAHTWNALFRVAHVTSAHHALLPRNGVKRNTGASQVRCTMFRFYAFPTNKSFILKNSASWFYTTLKLVALWNALVRWEISIRYQCTNAIFKNYIFKKRKRRRIAILENFACARTEGKKITNTRKYIYKETRW